MSKQRPQIFLLIFPLYCTENHDVYVWMLQVLNQDETPLLYSVVFGEGVVSDASFVVLFKAIQNFDLSHIDLINALQLLRNFLYLFIASTVLRFFVSFPATF